LHLEQGVAHLHCEGGGALMRMLIEEIGVDYIHLTWAAHTLFGGKKSATLTGRPELPMLQSQHYELTCFEPLIEHQEVFLSYQLKSASAQ
jgi:riboflavin biosynthesis pyrimidine reductase